MWESIGGLACILKSKKPISKTNGVVRYCFCSWASNRLITSKDHASGQINVGHSGGNGLLTGQFSTLALCGFVRAKVCPFFSMLL
ncbi:putative ribosomal protein S21e [Helianthus anomalus]